MVLASMEIEPDLMSHLSMLENKEAARHIRSPICDEPDQLPDHIPAAVDQLSSPITRQTAHLSAYYDAEDRDEIPDETARYGLRQRSRSSPLEQISQLDREATTYGHSVQEYRRTSGQRSSALPAAQHGVRHTRVPSLHRLRLDLLDHELDILPHMQGTEEEEEDARPAQGSTSLLSEVDSPGPVTPATPATWRPRELTLLRSRNGSEAGNEGGPTNNLLGRTPSPHPDAEPSRRRPSAGFLDGLGICGLPADTPIPSAPSSTNASLAMMDHRSTRPLARDVLPPIKTSSPALSYRSATRAPSPIQPPTRELRLASSSGPPSSARFAYKPQGPNASPVFASPARMPSSPYTTTTVGAVSVLSGSRLPVRHGPAFAASAATKATRSAAISSSTSTMKRHSFSENVTQDTFGHAAPSARARRPTSKLLSEPVQRLSRSFSDIQASLVTSLPSACEHPSHALQESEAAVEGPSEHDDTTYMRKKDQTDAMSPSASFLSRSSSRKGRPPPPLILLQSPVSSSALDSGTLSGPKSALSISDQTAIESSINVSDEGQTGMVDIDVASAQSSKLGANPVPQSAISEHFSTPLQSPAMARNSMTMASLAVSLQQVAAVLDEESTGAPTPRNEDVEWLQNELALEERATEAAGGGGADVNYNDEPVTTAVEAGENSKLVQSPRQVTEHVSLDSSTTDDAFAFDHLSPARSATDQTDDDSIVKAYASSDTVSSRERSSQHVHSSSDSSAFSQRPSSPEPMLMFQRDIFARITAAGQDPTADPRQGAQGRQGNVDEVDSEDTSAGKLLPSMRDVPLPTLKEGQHVDAKGVNKDGQSHSSQQQRLVQSPAPFSPISDHESTDAQATQRTRLRSRPSVPDVPSFGYMGTSSRSISPTFVVSPVMTSQPFAKRMDGHLDTDHLDMETSRWSSGSDDDDNRSRASSMRKSTSGNSRTRKNGNGHGGLSMRRTPTAGSSLTSLAPLKKGGGLFAGLGLRKKSMGYGTSDGGSSQTSSSPMPSDSPALFRSDGLREFPFPSLGSAGRPSLSLSQRQMSGMDTGVNSPVVPASPSLMATPDPAATVRPNRMQRQASTPLLRERFSSLSSAMAASATVGLPSAMPMQFKFRSRPSNANASIVMSSPQSATDASRTTTPTSTAPSSPVQERRVAKLSQASAIEQPRPCSPSMPSSPKKHKAEPESPSARAFHRSSKSLSQMSERFEQHIAAVTSARLQAQQQVQDGKRRSKQGHTRHGSRQRSITINVGEHDYAEIRKAAQRAMQQDWTKKAHTSAIPPLPTRVIEEGHTSIPAVPALPASPHGEESTPRMPAVKLDDASTPIALGKLAVIPAQLERRITDEDSSLAAVGRALLEGSLEGSSTPEESEPVVKRDHRMSSITAHVRRTGPRTRPHYPSLTETGREWLESHPDQPFHAALGPVLLEMVMQRAVGHSRDPSYASSEGYTSNSVSSEASSGSPQGFSVSAGRLSHGQGQNGSEDDVSRRFHLLSLDARCEAVSATEQFADSDDSFDRSGLASSIDPAVIVTKKGDGPLGKGKSDPIGILESLQKAHSEACSSHLSRSVKSDHSTGIEVSSSQLVAPIDIDTLTSRLHKLMKETSIVADSSSTAVQPMPASSARAAMIEPVGSVRRTRQASQPDLNKPLPDPIASLRTPMATTTSADLPFARRARQDKGQASIVSDFAHTVRLRSQSRSRMRPVAMILPDRAQPLPTSVDQPIISRINEAAQVGSHAASSDGKGLAQHGAVLAPAVVLRSRQHVRQHSESVAPMPLAQRSVVTDACTSLRIYLPDRSRVEIVQVQPTATARDVMLALPQREKIMAQDDRIGGWAIFEVHPSLGIERPLREYERIDEVLATPSHASNDREGARLLLKRTNLAPYLQVQALPNVSPALAGWLYLLDRRLPDAHWHKRWLELRNGILYLSSSEKGRDEAVLCHLNTTDVFQPVEGETWARRAPKSYAFALRNVGRPSSELPILACLSDGQACRHWITAISRARALVLHQTRPALFVNTAARSADPTSSIPAPSGATTSSTTVSASKRQPLLQLYAETYERGLLVEQASGKQAAGNGTTQVTRKPVPLLTSMDAMAGHGPQRLNEVQLAERQQRALGKPLIGLVPEKSQHTATQAFKPIE